MKTTTKRNNKFAIVGFILSLCLMAYAGAVNAQTIKQDANGNYYSVKAAKDTVTSYKATGKTFTTAKGETFPVYVSKNGKLFVIRTSRNNVQYKQYLKID